MCYAAPNLPNIFVGAVNVDGVVDGDDGGQGGDEAPEDEEPAARPVVHGRVKTVDGSDPVHVGEEGLF